MSVQLGRNLKIFITSNLSSNGLVMTTGFTPSNTQEIFIVSDTLDFNQNKSYEYISASGLMDTTSQLDIRAKPTLDTGNISFSTTLNTSDTGPFDARLWNATVNSLRYPLTMWTNTTESHTLKLSRQQNSTVSFGILIFVDNLVYVFDTVRVQSLNLSFGVDSVLVNNWSCIFEKHSCLEAAITTIGTTHTFSGSLSGTCVAANTQSYSWAGGKLAKITTGITNNPETTPIASTEFNLSIANAQNYIVNNEIDRTQLSMFYSDAGPATIEGSFSGYSRKQGSSFTLVQQLRSHLSDPYNNRTYDILLEVLSSSSTKICDILLKNCSLESSTKVSTVLTDTFNFKVISGTEAQNCFIKFYT
jgi:hypothetical protein